MRGFRRRNVLAISPLMWGLVFAAGWLWHAPLAQAAPLPTAEALLGEALQIARGIKEEDFRDYALGKIGGTQARMGKIGEALETLRGIKDEGWRAYVLASVAEAQAKAGRINEALDTARGMKRDHRRDMAMDRIAIAQARAGRMNEALETTREIVAYYRQGEALIVIAEMAKLWAKAGDRWTTEAILSEALTVTRKEWVESLRAHVLARIAGARLWAGDRTGAEAILREAFEIARRDKNVGGRAMTLGEIARGLAIAGHREWAEAALAQFTEAYRQLDGLARALVGSSDLTVAIARIQAKDRRLSEALKTARGAESDWESVEALIAVAEWAGNRKTAEAVLGEALARARTIKNEGFRAEALAEIARVMAEMGMK